MMSKVIHGEVITPIGKMKLFSENGRLKEILLPRYLDISLADNMIIRSTTEEPVIKNILDFLERYFKGEPVSWAGKYIPAGSIFFRKIWKVTAEIPFGETISYGELAKRAGNPKAARAAGSAMANNPLPILVPCHRVLAGDGGLGGFGGGLEMKKWLLRHEGIVLDD